MASASLQQYVAYSNFYFSINIKTKIKINN